MQEIAISKFKATCLAVLEDVRRTSKPVRVTRFGRPVAEIVPPTAPRKRILGGMIGTAEIIGDIVGPVWGPYIPSERRMNLLGDMTKPAKSPSKRRTRK